MSKHFNLMDRNFEFDDDLNVLKFDVKFCEIKAENFEFDDEIREIKWFLQIFGIPYSGIFSRRQIFVVLSKKTWRLIFADFNFCRPRKIISILFRKNHRVGGQIEFPSIDQLCRKKIYGQIIWNAREKKILTFWQTNKQKEHIYIQTVE